MKLGIGSYTFAWDVGVPGHEPDRPMTAADLLDTAQTLGVDVVQIADNLPLHRLAPAEIASLADRAVTCGLDVEVGTRGIAPDHLRAYLGLAVTFDSPILRVVTDTADHQPTEDEIVTTVRSLIPAFEEAGVTLAIENHDRFTSAALVELLERIDSDCVGICLDTVNSFGALEGPVRVVEALGPRTVNLHVKDFTITRASHQMGFAIEGRPAGRGRLDVPWLLNRLRSMDRDVNAILELWTPPEPELADTLAKERAWAAESVAYLRDLIPN
jgi:sugar phosphate isomerase/epimerase